MKKTGAFLAVYALEQIGVTHTFGIPGVHNTELYDALGKSKQIKPMLVTHEGAGAFMADGVSRTSDRIGTLVIVPAAGMTHAMSGIGEAFLDGVPMLVISGGTRRDSGRFYQLHQIDQGRVLDGIIKRYYLVERHDQIISTIYQAYETAIAGEPGPVFVEIPVEIQMFAGEVGELLPYVSNPRIVPAFSPDLIRQAVHLLTHAQHPGIYVGWGAVGAASVMEKLAERLVAPVSTTMQGLSAFSGRHGLHTGVGFGASAMPAGQEAFAQCDCLLAVGVRFSELATGSYGMPVPTNLIHVDINPEVFHKNYPATIAIQGDAKEVVQALLTELESRTWVSPRPMAVAMTKIRQQKEKYWQSWRNKRNTNKVSPGFFFHSLRQQLADDAITVVDDGHHTFLAAELFPIYHPRHFISPTDFNCMGYCVPASIGAKLANPYKQVAAIVGDGAFLMTGMELLTAVTHKIGVMVFVFHDGELGQISQFQQIPLNRKTCTILGKFNVEGIAVATGAHFLRMQNDNQINGMIKEALEISQSGHPVLIDVVIDYSRRTCLTKGVVQENLKRFPRREKIRFIARAVKRHVVG